jgi:hypothetical protein
MQWMVTLMALLISVGAEICFIGDTNLIVTKSVCTAIGAIVDNDLIDIFGCLCCP